MKKVIAAISALFGGLSLEKSKSLVVRDRSDFPSVAPFDLSKATTLRRDSRRRIGVGPLGIRDVVILRDDLAAERAAHTLNTTKRNHGQWHRWNG